MKKYSEDIFELRSRLTPDEMIERLSNRTLNKNFLAMVLTDKDFIGRVSSNSFEIINSSFLIPYGASCILKGTINQTSTITLTTTLHKAFRILLLVWAIVLTVVFVTFSVIDSSPIDNISIFMIGMPIMALIFRLFFHRMYVIARNRGLTKMKEILDVVD